MESVPTEIGELTPGQLAERSGVTISALHFYERRGLIVSRRTDGNQRRYPREVLRRIAFIRAAQRVGISLERTQLALEELPDQRTPTKADWERLSDSWRAELDHRIDRLVALRDSLGDCIGCGCLSLRRCTLANPEDVFASTHDVPNRLS